MGNTTIIKSTLGTSFYGAVLVRHSTHWSTLWVHHTYSSEFIQSSSKSNYKWMAALQEFIQMSNNYSYAVTPMSVTTDTDLSGSYAHWMVPIIPWFVVSPAKLNSGIFTTTIVFFAYKIYILNRTTGRWSAPSFTNVEFTSKDTSIDELST